MRKNEVAILTFILLQLRIKIYAYIIFQGNQLQKIMIINKEINPALNIM